MSDALLATRRRRRRFNKVSGLTISEVSLVDDPASPGSEVVLFKACRHGRHLPEESTTMNTIEKALDAAQGGKGRLAKAKSGDTASLADLQADLAEAGPILDAAMQEIVVKVRQLEPGLSYAAAVAKATAMPTYALLYDARYNGRASSPERVAKAHEVDAPLLS